MLQFIRDKVQGWIASAILLLLIIPFAFWGINYYFDYGAEAVVISVDGNDVPLRDYQRTLQNLRQRWIAATEGKVPVEDEMLKKQALDSLVNRQLLFNAAADLGLRVGDDQVRAAIEDVDAFRGVGGFDPVVYESAIGQMGLSPAGFESQVRDDLTAEQIQSAIVDSVFAAGSEVRELAALRRQARDIDYAVLSSDAAREKVPVSDADVTAYYSQNTDLFLETEQVKVAYLHITLQRLADEVAVDDAVLEDYYKDNAANYTVGEQREIRQILVPVAEDAGAEQVDAARLRAENLLGRIRNGTRMADIAAEERQSGREPLDYSEFGFLGRGVLDAEIEEAAFAAGAGQSVGPIRSRFGFHVIEVGQIKEGKASTFAEVRAEVARDFRHAEAAKAYAELADRLGTLAYENPDGLEPVAEALNLPIQESGLFSREEPPDGLLSKPPVMGAVFSDEVLKEHNNSELIELEGDEALVVRVMEHVPAKALPLEQVRERIVTRLRFERAKAETEKRGAALLEKLRSGASPAELASAEGIEWRAEKGVLRDDPDVNRAILRAAFSAGRPAGAPLYAGVSMGSGDYALVIVTTVVEPAPESLTAEDLNAVRDELERLGAANGWSRYVMELRARADVTIRDDLL
jgi:peptidyl-prolyl cis-trans isomerase D